MRLSSESAKSHSKLTIVVVMLGVYCFVQPTMAFEVSSSMEKHEPSIYDLQPSIYSPSESEIGAQISGLLKEATNPFEKDGSLRAKIHRDDPSPYTDSQGRTLTFRQHAEREQRNKIAFDMLKSQGYSWKEQKKKIDEITAKRKNRVPEDWQKNIDEVKERIKKEGPITSVHFVRPGRHRNRAMRLIVRETFFVATKENGQSLIRKLENPFWMTRHLQLLRPESRLKR